MSTVVEEELFKPHRFAVRARLLVGGEFLIGVLNWKWTILIWPIKTPDPGET